MNLFGETPTRNDLVREILGAFPHLSIVEIQSSAIAVQHKLTIEDIRHALRDLQELGIVRQTPPDDTHRAWRYYLSAHSAHLSDAAPSLQHSTTPTLQP